MQPQLIRNRRAFLPQKPRLSQPCQKLTVSGWTLARCVRSERVWWKPVRRGTSPQRRRDMNGHSLVAVYESRAHAERARDRLMQLGIPATDIRLSADSGGERVGTERLEVEHRGGF